MKKMFQIIVAFMMAVHLTSYVDGADDSKIESAKAIAALERLNENRSAVIRDLERAREIEVRSGNKKEAKKTRTAIKALQQSEIKKDTPKQSSVVPSLRKASVVDGEWMSWTNTRVFIKDGGIFDAKGKRIGDCIVSLDKRKTGATRVTLNAPSQRWRDPDMYLSSSYDMMVGKSGVVTVWWRKLH
jgi:hypothetical protein